MKKYFEVRFAGMPRSYMYALETLVKLLGAPDTPTLVLVRQMSADEAARQRNEYIQDSAPAWYKKLARPKTDNV